MTDPDMQQLIDLSSASIASFVMNEQMAFFLAKTHKDNSEIGEDEIVVLTITRRFIVPGVQPHPSMEGATVTPIEELVLA